MDGGIRLAKKARTLFDFWLFVYKLRIRLHRDNGYKVQYYLAHLFMRPRRTRRLRHRRNQPAN